MKPDEAKSRGTERMTDEDFARAQAEYDALLGTEPQWFSFIPWSEIQETGGQMAVQAKCAVQAKDGASFWRVTEVPNPHGVWVEGWATRPHKQADFNPPMTLAPH